MGSHLKCTEFSNAISSDVKSDIENIFKASTDTTEVEISDVEGESALLVKTKELSLDENNALVDALLNSEYAHIYMDKVQGSGIWCRLCTCSYT